MGHLHDQSRSAYAAYAATADAMSERSLFVWPAMSESNGGQGRNRTSDTRIFSAVLYQLSYLAPVK